MVISFAKLGRYGRLGNCCFQIASTLGVAAKNNAQAIFPAWSYENYFKLMLPHGEMQTTILKEEHFHYSDINITENVDLLGYFQSQKYFKHIKAEVRNQFVFKDGYKQSIRDKCKVWDKETIGIHIRRGDYVGSKIYHQLPINWFITALIDNFPHYKDCNIVLFSDDMDYCRIHFECLPNVTFTGELNDIDSLCLLTQMDNHIVSNSSFGWWGAWLSESKKIVHSGKMFKPSVNKDIKDYYPEEWTVHQERKIDIRDCTFTIPVFHDHPDRKQNLDLSVCVLQKSFDTDIIIGEQGSDKFSYMAKYCKYVKFDLANFHRTKMLNDMALTAETPIIANWDADIFIPPMQIVQTVDALRNGADVAFPYDGRFARLDRIPWFNKIEKALDIGAIGNAQLRGKHDKPVPVTSVGGAVFFNKESFIDGGMENEYMISFGPEDCERHDRFRALGYKIERAGGCLYHIDHYCGPDSNIRNPFFDANRKELHKIRAMTPAELKLYVDSWPWRHKYTATYYKEIAEGAIRSAKEVYKVLEKYVKFNSIIDIGCGIGQWNYKDYTGVDYKIMKRTLLIPQERYIEHDLEGELPLTVDKKFDLAVCVEVAEHLKQEHAEDLIDLLCLLSNQILFSAAIPDQGGTGHYNEQWATYWAEMFEKNGFYPYKFDLRQELFNNEYVELWYRNNVILYTRTNYNFDWQLNFIHPDLYKGVIQHFKNNHI